MTLSNGGAVAVLRCCTRVCSGSTYNALSGGEDPPGCQDSPTIASAWLLACAGDTTTRNLGHRFRVPSVRLRRQQRITDARSNISAGHCIADTDGDGQIIIEHEP